VNKDEYINYLKMAISGFPCFRARDPKFWTTIFKPGSLLNMWQSLIEFCVDGFRYIKNSGKIYIMPFHEYARMNSHKN